MSEDKGRNKKKIALLAIMIVAIIAFVGSGIYILRYYKNQEAAKSAYEELQKDKELQEERMQKKQSEKVETEQQASENEQEEKKVEIPVDFDALKAQNPDVYAWISIPGTSIDYPILQSAEDDTYYLNYTIDKVKGLPGSIYTESLNAQDFSDNNTVIYGHNMKNGSMFADLHKYSDNLFLKENPYVMIYTPDQVLKYQIFAAYVSDDKHILKTYDFTDDAVYQGYLNDIFAMRQMGVILDKELEVTKENKILTLSTCNSVFDQRWLVQAVLIEEE